MKLDMDKKDIEKLTQALNNIASAISLVALMLYFLAFTQCT